VNARPPAIRLASESMWLVEFEARIDPAINRRVGALARHLRDERIAGVRDAVATYRSLAIHVDPLRLDGRRLAGWLERQLAAGHLEEEPDPEPHIIPVIYGGECGPDLEEVADRVGCSPGEVVARHAAGLYRVYMMGFVAGFAYLGIVDPAIQVPRRPTPRLRVPRGSVAIAGQQTGVYPIETPGGWNILGRTDLAMFDASREQPSLLTVGDLVRFRPVGAGSPL